MTNKRHVISLKFVLFIVFVFSGSLHASRASSPLKVVVTMSILADFAAEVGGERVKIVSLVGAGQDVHVYSPTSSDAKAVSAADVFVTNGLGLEGWVDRLALAKRPSLVRLTASDSISFISAKPEPAESAAGPDSSHRAKSDSGDPHAWQDVTNAKIYATNIKDGLVSRDPEGLSYYEARLKDYLRRLDMLDGEIKSKVLSIPTVKRNVITSHDAFAYFSLAYGLTFIAPQGVSTETEASAKDVARIIKQIKAQHIPAVFLENISDPRLMHRIASETGAKIGARVYSDSLSSLDGPAGTYVAMMRHNVNAFVEALR